MALYFVGYDVRANDRAELENVLRGWGAVRLYDGAWLFNRQMSALEARNALQRFLQDDDAAIVLELKPGSWWASEHVDRGALEWLKAHVLT